MKKTILGAPGITGDIPELPLPKVLIVKDNAGQKNESGLRMGHKNKKIARSRRNLPGGK